MHNDGTGPRYDRPRRITRDEVRRPAAPAEPTEWESYQALLAQGMDDADARTTIWPDNALIYGTGEDGEQVLLPVGEDGYTVVPEGFAEGDPYPVPEPADGDDSTEGDDTEEEPETESTAGDAADGAGEPETPEATPEATDTENAAQAPAEPETPEETTEDETAPEPEAVTDLGYEPADHNRNDVQAYLAEHPDQTEFVLNRERTGKARVSLIGA
ncbi:hypothetical protein QC999_gp82 [Microbacterium phage Cressida]|uniref:Uncharacterized protein n=1 Tax=Microbacterium phage Cressida TaxID=2591216 RepID=A0A514DI24_9CAUD|nr:hypothetical protein QC999_gp82 [Microbacterium phage Cressida]QDH93268.1 hypothetical protein PBI_CRESSIDA_26 [Microbacterium phage Cressida]